jgi:hypothetical protein
VRAAVVALRDGAEALLARRVPHLHLRGTESRGQAIPATWEPAHPNHLRLLGLAATDSDSVGPSGAQDSVPGWCGWIDFWV